MTLNKIIKSFNKVLNDLDKLIEHNEVEVEVRTCKIEHLQDERVELELEAYNAEKIRDRVSALINPDTDG